MDGLGLYTLSGFLVGLIVGVTGVGGGSLMTPLLVLFFGISPATAVGTDLLYASLTKSLGGWVHGKRGTVDWKVVVLLSLGSLPAAVTTILLLKYLALDEKTLRSVITSVLSVALLATAIVLLFKEKIQKLGRSHDGTIYELHHRYLPAATIATGVVVGSLVTISSIGAGVLGTVALLFLYPRMPAVKVVGTDIVHAVPLTALAGMGHLALGTVDLTLLASLLLGSLPGIYIGSHLSAKVPEKILRPMLAVMLLIIGLKMVFYK
ncbi:MAG: sulfite exporter TauE/SafE family protein [Gallionella sp.]|nr:sulfite exporter TauE/SafE family protein [Gallionella sp.]MDD4957935.1 sulfite exporter TauE/SafE family protein [Gallionella sp.]